MRFAALLIAIVAFATPLATSAQPLECSVIHGRLQASNGTPSIRIWPIGTRRMLGVNDGPPGDELADLPENLRDVLRKRPFETRVYGDFHVCALTPLRDGEMQMVRIDSAQITAVRR